MATREETEVAIAALRSELNGNESEYSFHIPGWAPETSIMGFRWIQSQLWEGFYVSYRVEHSAKRVQFKCWEYGEPEPSWQQIG